MRDLEARLSWREFQEWQVYLDSRPPDGEVIDWQFARLMTVLARMFATGGAPGVTDWSLLESMRPRTVAEISAEVKRIFGIEG